MCARWTPAELGWMLPALEEYGPWRSTSWYDAYSYISDTGWRPPEHISVEWFPQLGVYRFQIGSDLYIYDDVHTYRWELLCELCVRSSDPLV